MAGRIAIDKSQIPLYFRALQDNGVSNFDVGLYPTQFKKPLYCFRLNDYRDTKVSIKTSSGDYREAYEAIERDHGPNSTEFSEIPNPKTYRESYTTGFVPMKNQNKINEIVEDGKAWSAHSSTTVHYIGFDTNLMGLRLGEQFQVDPLNEDGVDGYVLPTPVRRELEKTSGKRKLDRSRIEDLTDAFGHQYGALINQKRKRYRTQHLGLEYWRRLEKQIGTEIVQEDGIEDPAIIESYAKFANRGATSLTVFTNDTDFVTVAESRFPTVHVQIPDRLPKRIQATWDKLAATLYYQAVQFGVLKVPKASLYGVWSGKKPNDWHNDTVLLDFNGDFNLTEERLERYQSLLDTWEKEK